MPRKRAPVAYLPDEARRSDPTVSPLQASIEQLTSVPHALIMDDEAAILLGVLNTIVRHVIVR